MFEVYKTLIKLPLKSMAIWFVFVIAAMLNGMLREQVLVPCIGVANALPVSGILLSIIIFVVTYRLVSTIGSSLQITYIKIGVFWLLLTLTFEFLFGYFIVGKSWSAIMQVFDIKKGDLYILVLLSTTLSPWCAAKCKGII